MKTKLPFILELPVIFNSINTLALTNNILEYNKKINQKGHFFLKFQKDTPVSHFFLKSFLNIYTFCHIAGEIFLGTFVLITCAVLIAKTQSVSFTTSEILIWMIVPTVIIIFLYLFFLKPYKKILLKNYISMAMNPKISTGLSVQQICHLYPLFIATNQQENWDVILQKNNPNGYLLFHQQKGDVS